MGVKHGQELRFETSGMEGVLGVQVAVDVLRIDGSSVHDGIISKGVCVCMCVL